MINQLILVEKIEFIELIFIDKPLYNPLINLVNLKKKVSIVFYFIKLIFLCNIKKIENICVFNI